MFDPSPLLTELRMIDPSPDGVVRAAWLCTLTDDERQALGSELRALIDTMGLPPDGWVAEVAASLGFPPEWRPDEWTPPDGE